MESEKWLRRSDGMFRCGRLHETEIIESLIAAARRTAPMRLDRVSAVANSVSSAVTIDLRSILSMRSFTFGTDLPFGMNARMRNAWLYHGGGLEPQRAAIGIAELMPTKVSSPSLTAETGFAARRLGHAAEP